MRTVLIFLMTLIALARADDRIRDFHEWHQAAVKTDDTSDIDDIIEKFEDALEKDPKDDLARVYLGSTHTLRAAETFWGPSKLKYMRRGEAFMNEAIANEPDDPRIRFIRAVNAYRLPKRFKQRQTAITDFTLIMPIAKKGGHQLTIRERQAILYFAYLAFSDENHGEKAKEARQACLKIDPNSEYAKKIK